MASIAGAAGRPADGSLIDHPHAQSGSRIRLEWGPVGAELLAPISTISVVIDVLSFTTTSSVAADRGVAVHPHPWADDGAERLAVSSCPHRTARRSVPPLRVPARPSSAPACATAERRPAVEDLWGAGGGVAALEDLGLTSVSEEASAAAAAYRLVEARLGEALAACSSGRELADGGYAVDVAIAGELDESGSVPRLVDGAFVAQ